ncbi:MAG: hypothetical protein KatS3mg108_2075 [Isosphaeraceae bacterium]|jgi:hypothetical protein|nr:MAG: hypothetical protein KatS3mg108_2075 [Isosphaeraceae bacterium]
MVALVLGLWVGGTSLAASAQDDGLVVRPGPPPLERFETDADADGVADGWYNVRDGRLEAAAGVEGSTALSFENNRRGRPARASRAFGIDGRKHEAVVVGLWVWVEKIGGGERVGEDPGLVIDLLDGELKMVGRGRLGPWDDRTLPGGRWMRVAGRFEVPESTRDAILTVGLLGATGRMRVDDLAIELVPVGGQATVNLVLNGDLELGDRLAEFWELEGGARRVMGGTGACLELSRSGAQGRAAVAVPIRRFEALRVRLKARTSGLRAGGGAVADLFFLDETGSPLPGAAGGMRLFRFVGTSGWGTQEAVVRVPRGAVRSVLQVEKTDNVGTLWIDDVEIAAAPDPSEGRWTPYHVVEDVDGWPIYEPAEAIEPGSALDATVLLEAPAGRRGFVTARQGRLVYEDGTRARFFGVVLLPPLGVMDRERAERLADELARRGVNLVRLVDLDAPYGPGRSLLDDTAEDTATLDPDALGRLDFLAAALARRGISLALELVAARRFRDGDEVAGAAGLPPGGGPAAAFDPQVRAVVLAMARRLLEHVNPETGRAWRDEPALAWVTIAGELSLFDLLDDPGLLPEESRAVLRERSERTGGLSGRRLWQSLEAAQWSELARELAALGLRVPVAGSGHWRREPEFTAAQWSSGLALIEDRLYWSPPSFAVGARRSMVGQAAGRLEEMAGKKRRADRPYVVGQFAERTGGLWALPYEGADLLLAAMRARVEDWDALVRRGVFLYPERWGAGPAGTGGGDDLYRVVEVVNANPALFAMLPHAASIMLRPAVREGIGPSKDAGWIWDPRSGRLAIDTPHTQALSALLERRVVRLSAVELGVETPGATIAVSALGSEPIAEARRLLVTALGRFEPTGQTYADGCLTRPGRPGGGPLRREPIRGTVRITGRSGLRAFRLDNAGRRIEEEPMAEGTTLVIDGRKALHWELVVE